jgi:hypothetical protein
MRDRNPVILYRNDVDWKNEAEIANKYFRCVPSRCSCGSKDLVIPRFSALPFYNELEKDLSIIGAQLINSYEQHRYIADLGNWYYDLAEFTPYTWRNLYEIPDNGPFILKGETNSKKFYFKELMYAENKTEAIKIHGLLTKDSVLQYQHIYIRQYVELEKLAEGLQGLPITREYRFFVFKDVVLSGGFYWSSHIDELSGEVNPDEVPRDFLNKIIDKIQHTELSEPPNFYVLDVAKTKKGEWILVEVNDGSMSGISENDPEVLYKNFHRELMSFSC